MLDCGGIKERVAKFDNRHGAFVVIGNWVIFADGAKRECNPLGPLNEPPEDDWERAKIINQYWQHKLELAVEEFDLHKSSLLRMAKAHSRETFTPPPPEEALAKLTELKKKVMKLRVKANDAEAAVEEAVPENIKQRAEEAEENRQRQQDFVNRLSKIEI
jgi:hypothetical protein